MNYELFTGISLVTAFVGGMMALFAPCCITFLLPSYLANIFKEKNHVIWMTCIFGLGLATVLVPTALGIRAVGSLFIKYHTQTYVAGGVFMILLGAMELTGKKFTIPMLNLTIDLNARHDPWSIYVLGIFSGITSSCCTPVLAGILTLSFLSPSFFIAALAGLTYVTGMVVPLVIMALLLERFRIQQLSLFRRHTVSIGTMTRPLTDVVAGILFILVGITVSILALSGRIDMGTEKPLEEMLGYQGIFLIQSIRMIPGSEYLIAIVMLSVIVFLIRKSRRKRE